MKLTENNQNMSVKDLFKEFIKFQRKYTPPGYSSTCDDYESRLYGHSNILNGTQALIKGGAKYINQLSRGTLNNAKKFIVHEYGEKRRSRAYAVASSINVALRWSLSNSSYSINLNESDIASFHMPSKRKEKTVQLTDSEIEALCTNSIGKNQFEIIRNRILLVILALGHGLRSANEMVTLNNEDYDPVSMELTVHRKGKIRQTIPLRKVDCDLINTWMEIKEERINEYCKETPDKKPIDTEALFINFKPEEIKNQLTWRMPGSGPRNIFHKIKRILPISNDKVIGTIRHTSCTMQQTNAMALGYHENYVAALNSHTEKTERDYYVSIVGPEVEVLSRLPKDSIEFCESIAAHSFKLFLENPDQLRHLGCLLASMETIGRLQFREMLKKYRNGELDLEIMPAPSMAKSIKMKNPTVNNNELSQVINFLKTYGIFSLCPWVKK